MTRQRVVLVLLVAAAAAAAVALNLLLLSKGPGDTQLGKLRPSRSVPAAPHRTIPPTTGPTDHDDDDADD